MSYTFINFQINKFNLALKAACH